MFPIGTLLCRMNIVLLFKMEFGYLFLDYIRLMWFAICGYISKNCAPITLLIVTNCIWQPMTKASGHTLNMTRLQSCCQIGRRINNARLGLLPILDQTQTGCSECFSMFIFARNYSHVPSSIICISTSFIRIMYVIYSCGFKIPYLLARRFHMLSDKFFFYLHDPLDFHHYEEHPSLSEAYRFQLYALTSTCITAYFDDD